MKSVFFPLTQTQDPTLRSTKESSPYDVYGMKMLSQNVSGLDDDYIVETEPASTFLESPFCNVSGKESGFCILGSLSLYNKVLLIMHYASFNSNTTHTDMIGVYDGTHITSFIIGDFGFTTKYSYSLTSCDDNGKTKIFLADGVNPLRVIHIDKASLNLSFDNYVTFIYDKDITYSGDSYKSYKISVKKKTFDVYKYQNKYHKPIFGVITGQSSVNNSKTNPLYEDVFYLKDILCTSADALDVLSVAYDYDRKVTVQPKESSSASFKIGTYSIGLYEGCLNSPRSACVYDSDAIYLTSQTNKPNDVSNQEIVVKIKKAYAFSKDYMTVVCKNNTTGEYKESEMFFTGRLPIAKGTSFTAYTNNTWQFIKQNKSISDDTNVAVVVLSAIDDSYLDVGVYNSSQNDISILLSNEYDCFVYACFIVINYVRYDIPVSFEASFSMNNSEKVVPLERILAREKNAIIPTKVTMNKGRLLCCVNNSKIQDQNELNELIGLVGSASSIEIDQKASDDFINRNPESITKNSVMLPYTTYMFGYQFKNKYGVWTDILIGDSAANTSRYIMTITLNNNSGKFVLSTSVSVYYYKTNFFMATLANDWSYVLADSHLTGKLSHSEVNNLAGISIAINNNIVTITDAIGADFENDPLVISVSDIPGATYSATNYISTITFRA